MIAAMPDAYRCFAFDLPGHDAREREDIRGFEEFTEALIGAMDGLGSDPVHLVGHSLGGLVCADIARRFPDRIRTLCLLATPFDRTPQQLEAASAFLGRVEREGLFENLSRMKDRWYSEEFSRRNPDVISARLAQLREMDAGRFLATYRLYIDKNNETNAADLPMPVFLLSGAMADGFDTSHQCHLAERHANITCLHYPGMKNGILTECPARIARDLDEFFTAHSPAAMLRGHD